MRTYNFNIKFLKYTNSSIVYQIEMKTLNMRIIHTIPKKKYENLMYANVDRWLEENFPELYANISE